MIQYQYAELTFRIRSSRDLGKSFIWISEMVDGEWKAVETKQKRKLATYGIMRRVSSLEKRIHVVWKKKMSYAVRAAVLETVLNTGDGRMTRQKHVFKEMNLD